MKEVEYFTFMVPPTIWRKKPHPSSFKLTLEEAAERHPGATPILNTREVRSMPDTAEERAAALFSHFNGYSAAPRTEEEVAKPLREYEERMRADKQARRSQA